MTITDQQLDEYEALAERTTLLGAQTASPDILKTLVGEVRRLRAAQAVTLTGFVDELDKRLHGCCSECDACAAIARDLAAEIAQRNGAQP